MMPQGAEFYLRSFPIDGAVFEVEAGTYTAHLEREPVLQGCRVNYYVRFTSASGDIRRLVIMFQVTDLMTDQVSSRWVMFMLRRWMARFEVAIEPQAEWAIEPFDTQAHSESALRLCLGPPDHDLAG